MSIVDEIRAKIAIVTIVMINTRIKIVMVDKTKIKIATATMTANEISISIVVVTEMALDVHLLETIMGITATTSMENMAKNMDDVHHRQVHHPSRKTTLNQFDSRSFSIKTIY